LEYLAGGSPGVARPLIRVRIFNSDARMIDISSVARSLRPIVVAALICNVIGHLAAADAIRINARQSDEAIRQQLLSLTPVGTPIKEVYQFLQSRVHRDSRVIGGPEEPRPFSTGLATELGHYNDWRTFPYPTFVKAFWEFDKKITGCVTSGP